MRAGIRCSVFLVLSCLPVVTGRGWLVPEGNAVGSDKWMGFFFAPTFGSAGNPQKVECAEPEGNRKFYCFHLLFFSF